MNWNTQTRELFRRSNEDPANPACSRDLGRLYWHVLNEGLAIPLREGSDPRAFLEEERDLLDMGWIREVSGEIDRAAIRIKEPWVLPIQFVSEWLGGVVGKILGQDREASLRNDVEVAQAQIGRARKDFAQMQDSRRELLLGDVSPKDSARPDRIATEELCRTDALLLDVTRVRRAATLGKVVSANDRRSLVAQEAHLKKLLERSDALAAAAIHENVRAEIRSIGRSIAEVCTRIVVLEETVGRIQAQIADARDHREKISPLEIESRVTEETDYLRGLINLAAKRRRVENCAILRPGDQYFTPSVVRSCLDLVLELDPRMFRNDRVSYLGKPSVVLVPGNGNALYDWKNNSFVVPLVPPGGNFLQSLVGAVIEYRLDVDEEKTLINSYCNLPDLLGVKSIFQIKHHFTTDYMTWMISESQGFKVLTKEARIWFEHEIAPSKQEIYCPADHQSFNLSQAEFQKKFDVIENRLAERPLNEAFPSDLWVGGILNYQQARYDRAFECIKAYVEKSPDAPFGHYNLGQIALKATHKQEAVAGFTEFTRLHARSWWAGVAQEHLRRLRA